MATRIGTPGGIIPSPLGGGLTGAVTGFIEMRKMAEQARMDQERHNLEVRRFEHELSNAGMQDLVAKMELVRGVAPPGKTLGEIAPDLAGEIAQQTGANPEALASTVVRPYGPEDIQSAGIQELMNTADPEQLRRYGEIAAGNGQTWEEIEAAANQGRFAGMQAVAMLDWAETNPELYKETIRQNMGPDEMHTMEIGGQQLSLSTEQVLDYHLETTKLAEARSRLNLELGVAERSQLREMAQESRERMEDQVISIFESVGATAPPAVVGDIIDVMTMPEEDLSAEERDEIVNGLLDGASPEQQLGVLASFESRNIGTNALLENFRNDPELGPAIDVMKFGQIAKEVWGAEVAAEVTRSMRGPLERRLGASLTGGTWGRGNRIDVTGTLRDRVRQQAIEAGMSQEDWDTIISEANEEFGGDEARIDRALPAFIEHWTQVQEANMRDADPGDIPPGTELPPPPEKDAGGLVHSSDVEEGRQNELLLIEGEPIPRGPERFRIEGAIRQLEGARAALARAERAAEGRELSRAQQNAQDNMRAEVERLEGMIEESREAARRKMRGGR